MEGGQESVRLGATAKLTDEGMKVSTGIDEVGLMG